MPDQIQIRPTQNLNLIGSDLTDLIQISDLASFPEYQISFSLQFPPFSFSLIGIKKNKYYFFFHLDAPYFLLKSLFLKKKVPFFLFFFFLIGINVKKYTFFFRFSFFSSALTFKKKNTFIFSFSSTFFIISFLIS